MRLRLLLLLTFLSAGFLLSGPASFPHAPTVLAPWAMLQQPARGGTIRISANLVQVPVSVTDAGGAAGEKPAINRFPDRGRRQARDGRSFGRAGRDQAGNGARVR